MAIGFAGNATTTTAAGGSSATGARVHPGTGGAEGVGITITATGNSAMPTHAMSRGLSVFIETRLLSASQFGGQKRLLRARAGPVHNGLDRTTHSLWGRAEHRGGAGRRERRRRRRRRRRSIRKVMQYISKTKP